MTYRIGGRTPENRLARAEKKLPGASQEAIQDYLIAGATRSNAGVSTRLVEFARYLETERPFIVGVATKIKPATVLKGLGAVAVAAGAYEVLTAPPEKRSEVGRRLGLEFVGSTLAGEVIAGVLVAFTATPFGWVVAAGLAAGVAGVAVADRWITNFSITAIQAILRIS